MSDSGKAIFPDFGKLVPGFDFLQNLTKQASGAASTGMPKMPNLGSWVAPTLNVEELDRRIEELKAVQFWLDQNATALKATIQALQVQKMTLSALQGMNVNMTDMAKAFQVPDASGMASGLASGMAAATDMANNMAANMASMTGMGGMGGKAGGGDKASASSTQGSQSSDKGHHFAGLEVPETSFMRREQARDAAARAQAPTRQGNGSAKHDQESEAQAGQSRDPATEAAQTAQAGASIAAVVDPLQWWGALTQQFQTIANAAMQEATQRKPFEASQNLAQDAMRTVSKTASDLADTASKTLAQSANSARELMSGTFSAAEGWPMPGTGRGTGRSRAASGSSRKAAPARAGAAASDDQSASGRSKSGKASSARSAETKAKPARAAKTKASGSGSKSGSGRGSPQARGGTPARKASPRAR